MKKLIIICQVILTAFIITKILSYTEIIQDIPLVSISSLINWDQAIAQTPAKSQMPTTPPPKDVTEDGLAKERDLLALLQKKQKELDARENLLKSEEQKILALKKEVVDKIDALKALEGQLGEKLKTEKIQDEKRLKDLAKVYEATPPQKAAAMLEKMEVKTAAGITINMKRDRAGLIWGFLSPQKAVEITNEITKTTQARAE